MLVESIVLLPVQFRLHGLQDECATTDLELSLHPPKKPLLDNAHISSLFRWVENVVRVLKNALGFAVLT